jgi:hypothetical protein
MQLIIHITPPSALIIHQILYPADEQRIYICVDMMQTDHRLRQNLQMINMPGPKDHEVARIKGANLGDIQTLAECHQAAIHKIQFRVEIQIHNLSCTHQIRIGQGFHLRLEPHQLIHELDHGWHAPFPIEQKRYFRQCHFADDEASTVQICNLNSAFIFRIIALE